MDLATGAPGPDGINREAPPSQLERPRRMTTGGLLLEIPGGNAAQRADQMASRLRELFPERSRISRPVRKVELRLTGFDESVTPVEIATAISNFTGGCEAGDVRVGTIRSSRDGLRTVQAPAAAGVPIAEKGSVDLGWAQARAILLKGRPPRCFQCLAPGHVQQRCSYPRQDSLLL